MFYSGSDHFLIPDPDSVLASYAFRGKALVLVIPVPVVKKIRDPEKCIPDPHHCFHHSLTMREIQGRLCVTGTRRRKKRK
jgi:hypothetical protein